MMGEAKRVMGTTEDFSFSFPITPTHSPIDSPPLWTLSPATSPGPAYGYRVARKSSSYLEAGGLINIRKLRLLGGESDTQEEDENDDEEKEEEKMGMMWEAWNEELSKHRRQIMMDLHSSNSVFKLPRISCSNRASANTATVTTATANANANVNVNGNGNVANNAVKRENIKKKGSVVTLVKVLKKLFLLRQSAAAKFSKRRSR